MTEVRAVVPLKVRPGDLDRVIDAARTFVRQAAESEPDVLNLAYYVDPDGETIVVHEHYRSAAAMLAHLGAMDPEAAATLGAHTTVESVEVFGEVTDELRSALAAWGEVAYFRPAVSLR